MCQLLLTCCDLILIFIGLEGSNSALCNDNIMIQYFVETTPNENGNFVLLKVNHSVIVEVLEYPNGAHVVLEEGMVKDALTDEDRDGIKQIPYSIWASKKVRWSVIQKEKRFLDLLTTKVLVLNTTTKTVYVEGEAGARKVSPAEYRELKKLSNPIDWYTVDLEGAFMANFFDSDHPVFNKFWDSCFAVLPLAVANDLPSCQKS